MINKIIINDEKEYLIEQKKREKMYKDICIKSSRLWEEYERDQTHESLKLFFETFKKVDDAYLDWVDGIKYEYKEEI